MTLAEEPTRSAGTAAERASAAEQLLWLTEQLHRGTRSTVALAQFRLDGPVDPEALRVALEALLRRHPALRTAFVARDGQLWRQVLDRPVRLEIQSLSAGMNRWDAVESLCVRPYQLAHGDVLRVGLAADAAGAQLYLAAHHVAFDGYSEVVVAKELAEAYEQALAGRPPVLAELPRMTAHQLSAGRRAELTEYWRQALDGVADLPAGQPSQTHRELLRDRVLELPLAVPAETTLALRRQSRTQAVSLFALVLTAAGRALTGLTGTTDFCLGTPVSTRRPGQETEVGCELNILPLRLPDLTAPEAPTRVWHTVVDAMLHAELPLPGILACRPAPDTRRMPLYQALVAYQNWPRPVLRAGPARLRALPVSACGPQGEVRVEFSDLGPDQLTGVVQAPSAGAWASQLQLLADAVGQQLELLVEEDMR